VTLGHYSAASKLQKRQKATVSVRPLFPPATLQTRISFNTLHPQMPRHDRRIDLSTIRHRHGPPRQHLYLDQASRGDAVTAAKEATTHSLAACTPRGRGFTNPNWKAPKMTRRRAGKTPSHYSHKEKPYSNCPDRQPRLLESEIGKPTHQIVYYYRYFVVSPFGLVHQVSCM
jgi:hypothetical protein